MMSFILKKLIKFFIFKHKIKLVKLLVKFDKKLNLANFLNKNHFSELNQTSLFLPLVALNAPAITVSEWMRKKNGLVGDESAIAISHRQRCLKT